MNSVTVRVPATTANLASGFDTLGCALELYNTLTFTLSDKLSFTGCDAEYRNTDNLAWQAYSAVCKRMGIVPPPVRIDISADIPVSRGLGSSAAMLCGGAVAANALCGGSLSLSELLETVTPIEGHPDNLAPAFFGGLIASLMAGGKVHTARYSVHPSLRFVVLSPDFPLSTHAARAALPYSVSFPDAVHELSCLALLPHALESGDEELISLCLEDRLHQPYRRPLISGMDEVEALAYSLGCRCVCISGAGPSILCLSSDRGFAPRMAEGLSALPHNWALRELAIDTHGVRFLP